MKIVEEDPRQPLTRAYRSLVEFSIELRYDHGFRLTICDLRDKCNVDDLGEDFRPEDIDKRALQPVIRPFRLLDGSWDWAWWGPYPALVEEPWAQDAERAEDYRTDIAGLLIQFVPFDRFPFVCFPSETLVASGDAETVDRIEFPTWDIRWVKSELPQAQVGRHPLSSFLSFCVLYDIEALPPDVGIAPPAFFGDSPHGGRFIFLPPDTSKQDAHRVVEAEFEEGPAFRWPPNQMGSTGRRKPATRSLDDVRATYETYRLRKVGLTIAQIADALVETGFDSETPPDTTLRKRIATAIEDWNLPTVAYRKDDKRASSEI